MEVTAGIFLITKSNKLLITHPTNSPDNVWSIPKGLVDKNESTFEAAKRELLEETGIDLNLNDIVDIRYYGKIKYPKRKKYLTGYVVEIGHDEFLNKKLECNSMVHLPDKIFPENDDFKWVDFSEALKLIHVTQKKVLELYIEEKY